MSARVYPMTMGGHVSAAYHLKMHGPHYSRTWHLEMLMMRICHSE
jgi:hypothetical protein